ncbi:hypothetical protein [Microbacterium thalli]|uniref:Uncharacterized protein n=1 Tax=Microbacterium thalli TaxID=3027921 RepID=A0ABT5SGI3_9MICO|nr:hypothetical protein [Microbacterium thalli]MDD7961836.1 hypothetical protein [Microbacterium thalli]MDN8549238.1 hypothetical protein [Microbacterium thalli]
MGSPQRAASIWWERVRDLLSLGTHSHAAVPDLRSLESQRSRIERTHFLVNDRQRQIRGDRLYVLRRSRRDRRNPTAIAVYARGRVVGQVSDVRARDLAPLLDRIGGAALVSGTGTAPGSIRLWVDLPTPSALAAFIDGPTVSTPVGHESGTKRAPRARRAVSGTDTILTVATG